MADVFPIGVFDSGIGGLTVARKIKDVFPDHPLIYFGDTAHLPYGEKSREAIRHYSERISNFLLVQGCKLIVVACNSASSSAFDLVLETCGQKARAINVIDPMVNFISENFSGKKVGLIGTHRTVESGEYERRIKEVKANVELVSLATPLLVPMIEEGYYQNQISHEIIENYLADPILSNIEALVLACTHYPLIEAEIKEIAGDRIKILNSAEILSRVLGEQFPELPKDYQNQVHKDHFYVSDFTESFEHSTKKFFGKEVHLELMDLWD